jgi:hypothetical protein
VTLDLSYNQLEVEPVLGQVGGWVARFRFSISYPQWCSELTVQRLVLRSTNDCMATAA